MRLRVVLRSIMLIVDQTYGEPYEQLRGAVIKTDSD